MRIRASGYDANGRSQGAGISSPAPLTVALGGDRTRPHLTHPYQSGP